MFSSNPYRVDPYKNFPFRVKWDNAYVAGMSEASMLSPGGEVVTLREGGVLGAVHLSPGQTSNEPLTLKRGISHDPAFEQWANAAGYDANVTDDSADKRIAPSALRKDIIIEAYNEVGEKVMAFNVYRCWVSEFVGLPELDGMGSMIAIQTIVLQHEGWSRDDSVLEPMEATFTDPGS